jgi:hypothetical protein
LRFGAEGLGLKGWGSGSGVQLVGVEGLGFRVWGSGWGFNRLPAAHWDNVFGSPLLTSSAAFSGTIHIISIRQVYITYRTRNTDIYYIWVA